MILMSFAFVHSFIVSAEEAVFSLALVIFILAGLHKNYSTDFVLEDYYKWFRNLLPV